MNLRGMERYGKSDTLCGECKLVNIMPGTVTLHGVIYAHYKRVESKHGVNATIYKWNYTENGTILIINKKPIVFLCFHRTHLVINLVFSVFS